MRRLPVLCQPASAQPRALGGGQRQRARHMSAVRRGRRCDAGRVGRGEQRARDAAGFAVAVRAATPGVVVRPARSRRRWARKLAPGAARRRPSAVGEPRPTARHGGPSQAPAAIEPSLRRPSQVCARKGGQRPRQAPGSSRLRRLATSASASWPACAAVARRRARPPLNTAPPTHRPAPMRRAAGDGRPSTQRRCCFRSIAQHPVWRVAVCLERWRAWIMAPIVV